MLAISQKKLINSIGVAELIHLKYYEYHIKMSKIVKKMGER